MKAEETSNIRRVFEKKISKLAIIGFIIIILIGGLFLFKTLRTNSKSTTSSVQQTSKVMRGNIGVSISGSGSITSSNRVDLSPAVNGTITKVFFKEGDKVKAGDIIFQIDNANAIANIENIQNNISQNELTQNTPANDMSKLIIKAPFFGQLTLITPKIGDVLSKGATLCTISDQSKLKLLLPYSAEDVKSIKNGLKVTVNLQDIMESVNGIVTDVSMYSYSSSAGDLYNVEISIDNPGALKAGMKANADIKTSNGIASSTETGNLNFYNNQIIKTETGGTVKTINIKEYQRVKAGYVLFELDNNDMLVTNKSNELKMNALKTQLSDAEKALENYIIKAPIAGEITAQTTIVGSVVTSGTVLSTIADTESMQFEIPVDELDISKVKLGQTASITVDALVETSTTPLTGKVSKIAIEGTSSNGVTTYPVTIQVDQATNLKGGMNVNAEISISQKNDVLYVPIEAVQKIGNRALVMVKADAKTVAAMKNNQNNYSGEGTGTNANGNTSGNTYRTRNKNSSTSGSTNSNTNTNSSGNSETGTGQVGSGSGTNRRQGIGSALTSNPYYANSVPKMVEIGINNENYIEIISGLNEGDEVVLPPVVAAKSSSTTASGFGGLGGMGGGTTRAFSGGSNSGNISSSNTRSSSSGTSSGTTRSSTSGSIGSSSGGSASKSQAGD